MLGINTSSYLFVILLWFLISFAFGSYGDVYIILFLVFSLFNLGFLLNNVYSVEGGGGSMAGLSSFILCYEVLSNLFFSVGVFLGVESLVMFYVFMKFNVFPFVVYLYFPDLVTFEHYSWGSVVILSYILLSKVWGVLVFVVSPVQVGSLLFFSGFSLVFLLLFSGSGLSEYFISLLLLDGVMTLVVLVGGVDVVYVFVYIGMSYFFQVVSFKALSSNEDISALGLYCLFVLAGGPIHPLVLLKYLGFMSVGNISLTFLLLLVTVYVQYFLILLYLISSGSISGSNMFFYLMVFLLISVIILVYASWLFFTTNLMLGEVNVGVNKLLIKSFLCRSANIHSYTDKMPIVSVELFANRVKWMDVHVISYYSYNQGIGESGMPISLPLNPPVKVSYTSFSFIYSFASGTQLSSVSALYSHVNGLAPKDQFINSELSNG